MEYRYIIELLSIAIANDCSSFTELDPEEVKCLDLSLVRSITFQDFMDSLKRIRPSVSPHSLVGYEKWSVQYGDLGL